MSLTTPLVDYGPVYEKIKHLVVLMLENRSFDHVLGSLALEDAGRGVEGLSPDLFNLDSQYKPRSVKPLGGPSPSKRVSSFDPDPPHEYMKTADPESWPSIQTASGRALDVGDYVGLQISDWPQSQVIPSHPMGGFIKAFELRYQGEPGRVQPSDDIMGYYTRHELAVTYFLADQYTVCDHWHSAIPADTIPNRLYGVCGHSNGMRVGSVHLLNVPSVFDFLAHDWAIYSGGLSLAMMLKSVLTIQCPPTCPAGGRHLRGLDDFLEDAAHNKLVRFSWIEPIYAQDKWFPTNIFTGENDDHPPARIERGQHLIAEVYNGLLQGSWQDSALVLTYDEHGGFFDHVSPPHLGTADRPKNPDDDTFLDPFVTSGVRVPAIVVSAYAANTVSHAPFDHCSILKFVSEWVGTDAIRAWIEKDPRTARIRSQSVQNIATLLTLPHPRDPAPLGLDMTAIRTQAATLPTSGALSEGTTKDRALGDLQALLQMHPRGQEMLGKLKKVSGQ